MKNDIETPILEYEKIFNENKSKHPIKILFKLLKGECINVSRRCWKNIRE